jgi:hypothetical protein
MPLPAFKKNDLVTAQKRKIRGGQSCPLVDRNSILDCNLSIEPSLMLFFNEGCCYEISVR